MATIAPGTSDWSPASSVQLMKTGTDSNASPVWIMPVLSGTPACFDPLLKACGETSRPVYGVLDPYLAGHDEALRMPFMEVISLEVDAIMSKQPEGPYTLVGYSQGSTWIWAAAEILIKQRGQQVAEVLCIDPNFPNWSNLDKVLDYDGPQMSYGTGAPLCLLKCVMPMVFLKPMLAMDWTTAAKRDVNVANILKKASDDVNDCECLILHTEMDTGIAVVADPMAFVKGCAKGQKLAKTAELIASKFEGLDADFVRRVLQVRAVRPVYCAQKTPFVLPKSTKLTVIWADRSHMGLKAPIAPIYGIDRFYEGTVAEPKISLPIKPPADSPCARLKGEAAPWEMHFRVMHDPKSLEQILELVPHIFG